MNETKNRVDLLNLFRNFVDEATSDAISGLLALNEIRAR